MAKGWFDSIYDYITGENYDTDPNTPENRRKRIETPQAPPPPRRSNVPEIVIYGQPSQPQSRSAWEEMFGSSNKLPKQ